MRVCQFSVQSNHFHLLVEASGREGLSRGMQGFAIRVAKAVNRALGRAGRVFVDRYFARVLKTPREVRHAIGYVLNNARKHGSIAGGIDPCSSARWFDGWDRPVATGVEWRVAPVAAARTWLLRLGWRRHGSLELEPRAGG